MLLSPWRELQHLRKQKKPCQIRGRKSLVPMLGTSIAIANCADHEEDNDDDRHHHHHHHHASESYINNCGGRVVVPVANSSSKVCSSTRTNELFSVCFDKL